jgi:hypothetical protein
MKNAYLRALTISVMIAFAPLAGERPDRYLRLRP